MVPDFVEQIKNVQSCLKTQAQLTGESWKDCVKERYYDTYIDVYDKQLDTIVTGSGYIYGMGLIDLLKFIDEKQTEMESLHSKAVD